MESYSPVDAVVIFFQGRRFLIMLRWKGNTRKTIELRWPTLLAIIAPEKSSQGPWKVAYIHVFGSKAIPQSL